VLKLDVFDVRRVKQPSFLDSSEYDRADNSHNPTFEAGYPVKSFKYLRDERVQNALFKFCRLLGCFMDKHFIVGHLLGITKYAFQTEVLHRPEKLYYHKEAVILLNEFIVGAFGTGIEEDLAWIGQQVPIYNSSLRDDTLGVLHGYLDNELWNVPTSLDQTIQTEHTKANMGLLTEELLDNSFFVSLLLEGIGLIAQLLRKKFNDQLMHVLYPTYQKLGDSSTVVRRSALAALESIKSSCNYTSVQSLITANVDYLVDGISSQLRFNSFYSDKGGNLPVGLFGLRGVLYSVYSDKVDHLEWEAIIGLLEGTMDVVFECLDSLNSTLGVAQPRLIGVILHICHAIENIFDRFLQSASQTKFVLDFISNLTKHIIEKALNFLSIQNKQTKLVVFDILTTGVKLLCKVDSMNNREHSEHGGGTFLPVVHQIWVPLKKKFTIVNNIEQLDTFLLIQVFALVGVLSELSKDFVSARIESDLMPLCFGILQKCEGYFHQNKAANSDDPRSKLTTALLQCLKVVMKNSKPTTECCQMIGQSVAALYQYPSFKQLVSDLTEIVM